MKIYGRSVMSDFIPKLRASVSDVWIPQYARAVQAELKKQAAEAAQIHEDGGLISERAEVWNLDMIAVQQPIALAMEIDGYRLTETEFGKTGYCWRHATDHILDISKKVFSKAETLDFGFDSDELLARRMEPDVNEFVTTRTKSVTGTSLDRMSNILDEARGAGLTIIEQARALEEGMLGQSRSRSELIARTATIWNYNHAAKFGYIDAGLIEVAWLVTDDDLLCEFCLPMEGEVADMNANYREANTIVPGDEGGSLKLGFEVEHPPLHPRCRCAIIGVL